jgi:hypothetical protein
VLSLGFALRISSARGLKVVGITDREDICSTTEACAMLNCSIIFDGNTVAPNISFSYTNIEKFIN